MILCCGECLIDFIPTEARDGSVAYRPANGGAMHNVALALARLGVPAGIVGGLSTDLFGDKLAAGLAANGVRMEYVSRLDRPTTLAFVSFEGGEARYAFFDAEAADRHWRLEDMPAVGADLIALQFGGISLLRQPAADAYAALMEREAACRVIAFDPNIRPNLVGSDDAYRARLDRFFRRAHVVKASEADLAWLAPGRNAAELAAGWLGGAARIVLITRGEAGATAFARRGRASRLAVQVEIGDTVGAGDAFMAGVLAALHDRSWLAPEALDQLSDVNLAVMLDFASAVAAVNCARIGADPPRRSELASYIPVGAA
jgi:fructokinase